MIHFFIKKAMLFVGTINTCLDQILNSTLSLVWDNGYVVQKLFKENNKIHNEKYARYTIHF